MIRGRFAPSATGRAHPGTLLSALLAWLDARQAGGECWLRLEDLDPQRCRQEFIDGLQEDLAWFGLSFDHVQQQSSQVPRYHAVIDQLAAAGLVYGCRCSRRDVAERCPQQTDGSRRYDNFCRNNVLTVDSWRGWQQHGSVRLRLPASPVSTQPRSGPRLAGQRCASEAW